MALIVEDGTGKADADSYIAAAAADSYHADRGNAAWAALTSDQKDQALRRATDYMLGAYAGRWAGERVSEDQALDWPRYNVPRRDMAAASYWPSDEVPTAVARACAEFAVRASADDLLADAGAQVKSETVGPISVTYADGARQSTRYAALDAALAPFLKAGGQLAITRA